MKKVLAIYAFLFVISMACNLTPQELTPTDTPEPVSENRCGDGVCDGPENASKCPEDCIQGAVVITQNEKDSEEEQSSVVEAETGYRRVSLMGTINTHLNTSTMGDFTGDAFEYTGAYSIELWFPLEGGKPVKQRNTITLTEYNDLFFGESDCRPCDWDLNESAYQPVSFDLDATLTLDVMMEGGQLADELVFQILTPPMVSIGGIVNCPCPGAVPDEFTDPSAIPVLMSWFYQKLAYPLQLNFLRETSVEAFPISPMYDAEIPEETLFYTIVDDFNQ